MTGLVATANPPEAAAEPLLCNDGWFPDMEPAKVRAACLLDGTVTTARLIPALQAAVLSVNRELDVWQQEQRTRWGYDSLADVPAAQVDGQSAKLIYYRRAVHACLQADLAEAYREQSTLPNGANKADRVLEALVTRLDENRRNQRWAVADLLGTARTTVDLI